MVPKSKPLIVKKKTAKSKKKSKYFRQKDYIFAKRAKLLDGDNSLLILENGTIHSENKEGEIKAIDFQKTRLNLSGMKTKDTF